MHAPARLLVLAIAGCVTACGSSNAALRASDSPLQGPGAGAFYEIMTNNTMIGDVKVWSSGAHAENGRVYVEMGLRIRNNVQTPITVDTTGCGLEVSTTQGVVVVDDEEQVSGTEVLPAQMERITLRYVLPAKTNIDDITGLDFYWRLMHDGDAFTRSTTFQLVARNGGRAYYYPYYGYPYMGFGVGLGYYGGFGGWGGNYRGPVPQPPMRPLPPRR